MDVFNDAAAIWALISGALTSLEHFVAPMDHTVKCMMPLSTLKQALDQISQGTRLACQKLLARLILDAWELEKWCAFGGTKVAATLLQTLARCPTVWAMVYAGSDSRMATKLALVFFESLPQLQVETSELTFAKACELKKTFTSALEDGAESDLFILDLQESTMKFLSTSLRSGEIGEKIMRACVGDLGELIATFKDKVKNILNAGLFPPKNDDAIDSVLNGESDEMASEAHRKLVDLASVSGDNILAQQLRCWATFRALKRNVASVAKWWTGCKSREDKLATTERAEQLSQLRLAKKASGGLLSQGDGAFLKSLFDDAGTSAASAWHLGWFDSFVSPGFLAVCIDEASGLMDEVQTQWHTDLQDLQNSVASWCPDWQAAEAELMDNHQIVEALLTKPKLPNYRSCSGETESVHCVRAEGSQRFMWHVHPCRVDEGLLRHKNTGMPDCGGHLRSLQHLVCYSEAAGTPPQDRCSQTTARTAGREEGGAARLFEKTIG